MIKLIVGLGNPGKRYEHTRHNAGFWWVDNLAQQFNVTLTENKNFKALCGLIKINNKCVWLLEPQTFMNLSGFSVAALVNFYKIKTEEILVVHDELDLAAGKSKLKQGGSHAGHNGLKDIKAKLGTDQYWRLRIGIDRPQHRDQVITWVLEPPSVHDLDLINDCLMRTLKAFPDLISGDFDRATISINTDKPVRAHKTNPKDKKDSVDGTIESI
jgi:peptidyl-tRNA hydrolase, PTH1 family